VLFTYDEHGHPELGKVSKSHIFNELLGKEIAQLGLKVKSRPDEIGYEVRCCAPASYDLVYCSMLGMGVYNLFSQGITGCMVYVDQLGEVSPLYLKDLQDPSTGKIPPRLVNIGGNKIQSFISNIMDYITPDDYQAAKEFVKNPEAYDFYKILNW
ncbi:MAG: 6-phosphofructokinase, partial [Bacteroidales bacterium]|nr:6-phosphofructokinase [Bacteroidales bacterium]